MLPVIFSSLLTELLDVVSDQLSAVVVLCRKLHSDSEGANAPLRGKK